MKELKLTLNADLTSDKLSLFIGKLFQITFAFASKPV